VTFDIASFAGGASASASQVFSIDDDPAFWRGRDRRILLLF
jgi:hypothetical protein